jgi:CRP-like cAMP-binding protein
VPGCRLGDSREGEEVVALGSALTCLRQIPMFRDLPDADLQTIVGAGRIVGYAAGERLFAEGDPAQAVFVVKSGQVELSVLSREGRELVLGIAGPGEVIGQEGLFSRGAYRCSARALAGACCLALGERSLREVLAAHPDLAVRLVVALSHQLTEAQARMADLALYDAKARCLKALHTLAARYGRQVEGYLEIPLRLSHADLARMINVSRSTATEILIQLRREGHIRMVGGRVHVRPAPAPDRATGLH